MPRRNKPPPQREVAPVEVRSHWSAEPTRHVFTDTELESMRRMLEQQDHRRIRMDLGVSQHEWDKMLGTPRFQREYALQAETLDRSVEGKLSRLSGEALDVVRDVMREMVSPTNRLRAALEILDRSGYVKVEKRISITADAESVIRELNRLGTAAAAATEHTDVVDAEVVPPTEETHEEA